MEPLIEGVGFDRSVPVLSDLRLLVATWFGAGLLFPLRAFLAVASAAIAVQLSGAGRRPTLAAFVIVTIAGFWSIQGWYATIGAIDDRRIVIDEVAGFLLALVIAGRVRPLVLVAMTLAFLALDRIKPWPFDRVEGVPGASGVLLDDMAAGLPIGLLVLLVKEIIRRRAMAGSSSPGL